MEPDLIIGVNTITQLFPVWFVVNDKMCLVEAGDQFIRHCRATTGDALQNLLIFPKSATAIASFCGEAIVLRIKATNITLEGFFQCTADNRFKFWGRVLSSTGTIGTNNSFEDSLNDSKLRKFIDDNLTTIDARIGKAASDNTIGIIISDNYGSIEWVNSAFLQTTGFAKDEIKGKRPSQFLYGPESTVVPVDYVDQKIKDGKPFTFENIGYTKNGRKIWFKATVHPFFDANEVRIGRFSTFEDITEQKENEELLLKREELWRFAIEGIGDGVWVLNPVDNSIFFSGRFKELLGYRPDEMLSPDTISNLIHPEDKEKYFTQVLPSITISDPIRVFEHRLKNKDGSYRYYQGRGKAVEWNENNQITKIIGTITDIHVEKLKDISIKTYIQQLSMLLEHLNEGILFEDEHGEVILLNSAFFELFGLDRENVDIATFSSCSQAKGLATMVAEPAKFIAGITLSGIARVKKVEERILMKDGRTISRDYLPVVIDGKSVGQIWKFRDISERISRETEMNDLKKHYEHILHEIPADIVLFSTDHKYSFINRYSVKNSEMREWLQGKDDYDYCIKKGINVELANRRRKFFVEVIRTRKEVQFIEEVRVADGSTKYLLRIFSPCISKAGKLENVIGYGVDITELKMIQAELQRQKEYYHQILDTIPSDLVVLDAGNKFLYINRSAVKDDGLREFLLGKTMEDYCRAKNIGLELAEKRRILFEQMLLTRKEIRIVEEFGKEKTNVKYVLRILFPYFNSENNLEYVIVYGIDISEQIRNEKLAQIQSNRMRNLLEIINDGVLRFDGAGEIYLHNKAFAHILEIPEKKLVKKGFNFYSIFTGEQLPGIREKINMLDKTRKPQTGMIAYNAPGGLVKHIDYTLAFSSVHSDSFYVARISDVTEIINKETNLNRIIQKERQLNTTKSQFVRLTSHELRTPLAIILSNAELLEMVLKASQVKLEIDPDKMITRILREVNLMTEILNQLMIISKIEEGRIDFETEDVELVSYIAEIKEELYDPYKDGRSLIVNVANSELILHCDRRLLRQAVVNIANNAFKYSPNAAPPEMNIFATSDSVNIQVVDCGIGIPEKDQTHLFNPFFRASNVKSFQGTGLGLMVVEYVVNKHNGKIRYQSKEGEGTTFTLIFPISG